MRTEQIKVAENLADAVQIAKENNFGPVGTVLFIGVGYTLGLMVWSIIHIALLFGGLRYRKKEHHLPFRKYLYTMFRELETYRLINEKGNAAYIRTRMGR